MNMNLAAAVSQSANMFDSRPVAQFWRDLQSAYPAGILELAIIVLVQAAFFWVPSTLLLLLDIGFPEFSNRHKIQSERRQPTREQIKHCVTHVAINNINGTVIQLVASYLIGLDNSLFRVPAELPALREILMDLVFAIVAREILFYYAHRLFHHPRIYKQIHKSVSFRYEYLV
jgi:methylsterol monooxygenase